VSAAAVAALPDREGSLYLATVIDCHTKAVSGWAMGDNYKAPLIEAAIEMAARNHELADGAIFHSDTTRWPTRSSQPSRTSGPTALSTPPANTHDAILPGYIELRYSTRRCHSGLEYRTPRQVNDEYLIRQLAA
jgi:transposase InsO family protein